MDLFGNSGCENGVQKNSSLSCSRSYYNLDNIFLAVENSLDIPKWRKASVDYYPQIILVAFAYLFIVQTLPIWLKKKGLKPQALQKTLVLWNALFAIFSMLFFYRTVPLLVKKFDNSSNLYQFFCFRDELTMSPTMTFWQAFFAFSKLLELGDTLFLILRHRPVIFLHYYHHSTALLMGFYYFPKFEPFYIVSSAFNSIVHSIMYTYFTLKALDVYVPKGISMSITSLQLVQFIIVTSITLFVHFKKLTSTDSNCDCCWTSIVFSYIFVLSYLVLFFKFFISAYGRNAKKITARNQQSKCAKFEKFENTATVNNELKKNE